MTDLECTLIWAEEGYHETGHPARLAAAYCEQKERADETESNLALAIKLLGVEKERADKAEAALKSLIKILDPEPLGTLSGMANMDNRLEWYEKMRPLREEARKIVTSPRLEGGEG